MNIHLKVRIDADELGMPGNRHHCAIANAIMLADSDVVLVRVDEDNIRFSRRSTNTRYTYATPARAATFIREFDRLISAADGGGKVRATPAKPFTLELGDDQLIAAVPRRERNASYAVQHAAVKAFGPTLAKSPVAQVKQTAAAVTAGAPRKAAKPTPRRRPSIRASA